MNNGRKRIVHRPNKVSSALGAIVGIVFVILGVVVVIPTFGLFGIFWTMIAVAIAVFSIFAALGKKIGGQEMYSHEMIIEDMSGEGGDIEARLKKLEELYNRRVISKDEYDEKRREILKEL